MLDARGAGIRHIFKLVSAMLLVYYLKSLTVQFFNQLHHFTVYFRRTIKFDARVANLILYYSNVNVLRNDNNVARVKSKRIETSICSIINIKLSTPIFGRPML